MINTIDNEKLEFGSTGEEKEMKNVEQNENSPVEIIEGRLKWLRTNEIDGRERDRLREEKGGRA